MWLVSAIIENKGKLSSTSMGEVSQVLTTVAAKILKSFLNITNAWRPLQDILI